MSFEEWKEVITNQIDFDVSIITSFDTTINILCQILAERDRVYQQYIEDGAKPLITFESDRGAKNPKQNPLLRQWNELNTTALSYLRELGLTAAGLKKLQGQLPYRKTSSKWSKLPDFDIDD